MTLKIKSYTLGIVATNAYLIGDDVSKQAVLIDPVDEAQLLVDGAQEEGWEIALILATHAHFDHVLASAELKRLTGAPFALHAEAAATLESLPLHYQRYFGILGPQAAVPDRLLTTEPEIIEVGAIKLETLYTPGHAPGHISFNMPEQKIVFSGDALFAGSIGRTDLPGGNLQQLLNSISTKLLTLTDDTTVLSGHGEPTTIGQERSTNPFLQF
ncbi:MAG: beta-lactamase domain protein [Chloroflexi bacterium OLB15]|nr:MAG: beta-lactamase domain protein [Chloroflexi bacterium OLB15]